MNIKILISLLLACTAILIIVKYPINNVYVMPVGPYGCFGGQPVTELEKLAVQSSFSILHSEDKGNEIGSATLIEGHQGMMITVSHIISPVLYAKDYTGKLVVKMKPIYVGKPQPWVGMTGVQTDDIAVLVPDDEPAVVEVLQSMKGVRLGQIKDELLFVKFDSPGGPDIGTSGAGFLDENGALIGILAYSASRPWPRTLLWGQERPLRNSIPSSGWGIALNFRKAITENIDLPYSSSNGTGVIAAHPWNNCIVQKIHYQSQMPST